MNLMIDNDVEDALQLIRGMRGRLLEDTLFPGMSASARALGGVSAVCMAIFLSATTPLLLPLDLVQLVGDERVIASLHHQWISWIILAALVFSVNVCAVLRWYIREDGGQRDFVRLAPLLDAVPPLLIGALFTLVTMQIKGLVTVPVVWVGCFGLVNLSARRALPARCTVIGWLYLLAATAGAVILTDAQRISPWYMGLTFGTLELWAAFELYLAHSVRNHQRQERLAREVFNDQ